MQIVSNTLPAKLFGFPVSGVKKKRKGKQSAVAANNQGSVRKSDEDISAMPRPGWLRWPGQPATGVANCTCAYQWQQNNGKVEHLPVWLCQLWDCSLTFTALTTYQLFSWGLHCMHMLGFISSSIALPSHWRMAGKANRSHFSPENMVLYGPKYT